MTKKTHKKISRSESDKGEKTRVHLKKVNMSGKDRSDPRLEPSVYTMSITPAGSHVELPTSSLSGFDIEPFNQHALVGECDVIDCTMDSHTVSKRDLENIDIHPGGRILLKTRWSGARDEKKEIFFEKEALEYIRSKGVSLLGIDCMIPTGATKEQMKSLCTVFESLDLKDTEPGKYIFVGCPTASGSGDKAYKAEAYLLPL